ncbi:D-alanyl-D-alanine carboxypeptidase (plasmid) [Sinorhizobium fredii CCBAU 83666]|nr:D-alanyl-D-alanine carboxypeptidase [Sinorhizobium fredii CCBAU 83666]
MLPWCETEAMQHHLAEISWAVDKGAHAVLILDQAGWHVTRNSRCRTTLP